MKRHYRLILILLLLGFDLRVWNLAGQSFWWDEAFTWQTISHGLANFWQMLLTGDRNPPLYFVSVVLGGNVTGWSEFSLRFVSVCWMMIGLAFLYNLAKRAYSTSAGLWALALAVNAPALVVYAQEARMYAAFFALAAATLYFAWRIFEISGQPSAVSHQRSAISGQREIWAFLLCEAGLLLTHYFAIPLVATLNLFVLFVLLRRRARFVTYAKWIGGQVLAALPLMIWTLIVFTTPGSLIRPQETSPDAMAFIAQVVTLWLSGTRGLQSDWIVLPWLAWLILPVALLGAWTANRQSTRWVTAFAGTALAGAYLMTLLLTSFHPRYALPYSVPLFVMIGAALSNLSASHAVEEKRSRVRRWFIGAVAISLVLVALVAGGQAASATTFAKDDARGVAAYLKQNAAADDVILIEANDYTLNYYDHGPAQTKMITATTELEALRQLQDAIGSAQQVWLPHWKISTQDPRGYWPFLFELAGSLKAQTAFHGYDLFEYELASPLREAEMEAASADGMLTQCSNLVDQGTTGALAFALTWLPSVQVFEPTLTSVRLSDARGNTLGARDGRLLDEGGRTTDRWLSLQPATNYYVLPIPPGTPPGTYTVTAQLYDIRGTLADEVVGTVELSRQLDTSDPYRTLAGYKWLTPTTMHIVSGLTLEAYAVSPQKPWQPMPIAVTLRWRKTGEVPDFAPRLRLAQAHRVWNEIESTLLEREYPIAQWVEGETVIDRLQIDYPPVRGPIELQVGQGDQWVTLTVLQLDELRLRFNPPSMQHTQTAQFGDFAELLGYDLNPDSLSAARPLDLTLYWRATNTEPLTTPYTVFTQILAPDGHLVAQADAPPQPPTVQWVPGQIVSDEHWIKIVDPAYRGPATLIVGWYNSASVERVPVKSGGDYVTLHAPVRVEEK
ncbi:hypothetical protein TFLX_03562 [Thermoflexales bacterium]|nr:hypothetical protein TFLX_03562 [Thermoflexales bacterium]